MNGVQLETAALALTLPESSPASLGESRSQPSFDDHLQQARRQEERSPRSDPQPLREEPPAERSESPSQSPTVAEQAPAEDDRPTSQSTPADSENEEADGDHEDIASGAEIPTTAPEPSLAPADQLYFVVCAAVDDAVAACGTPMPSVREALPDPASIAAGTSKKTRADAPVADGPEAAGPEDETLPQTAVRLPQVPSTKKQGFPAQIEEQQDSFMASPPAPEIPAEGIVDGETPTTNTNSGDAHRESHGEAPTLRPDSPAVQPFQADTAGNVTANGSDSADGASAVQASSEHATAPPIHEQSEAATQRAETSTQPVAASGEGPSTKAPNFLLPGRGAQRASGVQQLSDAERTRLVQRVARALETAGEGGQMRLRLSPPELGSLRLDVSVRQGVLTAHVEAETPQARMLLLDNLPALRDRLQEQNVKIERFDVDLMNQPSGGQPQGYRQRDQNQPDEPAYQSGERVVQSDAVSEPRPAISRRLGGGEQLNVVI